MLTSSLVRLLVFIVRALIEKLSKIPKYKTNFRQTLGFQPTNTF